MTIDASLHTYGIGKKKQTKYIKKIKYCELIKGLFVITMPIFGDGLYEIYEYNELLEPIYREVDDKIHIIGMAKGKDDALSLIVDMVQELYDEGRLC